MKKFFHSLITGNTNRILYLVFRPVFLPVSVVYIVITWIVKFLYKTNILKSVKLKAKVISIGNITWGGTGKTSLILLLSKFLEANNKKTAILIRGYGGDEDRMLSQKLNAPVLSGRDRIKNAKEAQDKYNAEILLLDDGFQHWCIKRDLDIVAINATNPFGNGKVIPAGILREPLSALKRSDIIIITKVNLAEKQDIEKTEAAIHKIAQGAEIFQAQHKPVSLTGAFTNKEYGLDYIKDKAILAVAAIGDNDSFFKILSNLGARVTAKFSYPDHHKYTKRDIENITNALKKTGSYAIVTTQKDWVRLEDGVRSHSSNLSRDLIPKVLLLNIAVKIEDEDKFFKRISGLFSR